MTDRPTLDLGIEGVTSAEHVGSGGAADVYRAEQPRLGRTVAVKILRANTSDESRARFEREAQTLGRLSNHPGIVTLHEAGLTAIGQPFLMMEYCPDGTLADRTAREGPIGWQETCRIVADIATVVDEAHQSGVLHRDLKPANVLIDGRGKHLIADFGVAALSDTGNYSAAADFTPGYAPPETLRGEPATPAGDVYSLGATAHALITGRVPFEAATTANNNVLAWIRRIETEAPENVRPLGVPDGVAAIIEGAMSKDPAARPTMSVLAGQLSAAADGILISEAGPRMAPPIPPTAGNPPTAAVSSVLPQKPISQRRPSDVPDGETPPTPGVVTPAPPDWEKGQTTAVPPILPQKPTSRELPVPPARPGPSSAVEADPATAAVPAILPSGPTTLDRPDVGTSGGGGRSGLLIGLGVSAVLIIGLGAVLAASLLGGEGDQAATTTAVSTTVAPDISSTTGPTTTTVATTAAPVPVVAEALFTVSNESIALEGSVPDRSTAASILEVVLGLYEEEQIDDKLEIDSTVDSVTITLDGELASTDRLTELVDGLASIEGVEVDEQIDIVTTTAPPTTSRPATTRRAPTTKAPATAAPTTAAPTTAAPTTVAPPTTRPPAGSSTTNSPLG